MGELPGSLGFNPPRIYVLKDVWDVPASARRAERVAQACPDSEVRTFTYESLPDIVAEEGWDHSPRMGSLAEVPHPSVILGLFRFDPNAVAETTTRMREAYSGDGGFPFDLAAGGGAFSFFYSRTKSFQCPDLTQIRPNPEHVCRPQWRIHQGSGCPHQCAYCSLGGYIVSHVNTEEYIEKLGELLRNNPWQKTWLYDDVMDVLTLEPELDTLAPLMRFFESTGDRYLIIHTKSDRVQALIESGAPSNTIVAWSLSGSTQSRLLEPVAGTTETRIEAARLCELAGITVRYKFKPIIPVRNWREEAEHAIQLALAETNPDNLSMTVLMWMQVEALKECIPESLLDSTYLQAAEDAAADMRESHVAPYPPWVREEVYRHCLSAIRAADADIPVTLSTETLDMWKSMREALGTTPGTYVCGCGAGATPGKQTLDSNPWTDARDALTWDGEPPLAIGRR